VANGDPKRGDAGDGYRHDGKRVERRRTEYLTCDEFRSWKRRATAAFLLLVAVSVAAAYLGYHAGRQSDANIAQSGADAVFRSCVSRADIRITVADALDDLRSAAVRPDAPKAETDAFFERTQAPLNDLLALPAGRELHTVGRLPQDFLDALRARSVRGCRVAAERQFGVKLDADADH
jgi:hypothetical protein